MVLIHRWSVFAGSIAWEIYPRGSVNRGLYKQVVFIRTGFTVCKFKVSGVCNLRVVFDLQIYTNIK